MPRTIPQKNGPGQVTRCQSVRGCHSLTPRSHTPETVASSRTAKESALMWSDEGASASLPRNPRSVTLFEKRFMVAPPEGGQRRLRGIVLRNRLGVEVLPA